MNMKFFNNICLIVAAVFPLYSCDSMFTLEEDNNYDIGEVNEIPERVLGFLDIAYTALPTDYSYTECATDDAVMNEYNNEYHRMVNGGWGPTFDPLSVWESSYKAIDGINRFFEILPQTTISKDPEDDLAYRNRWTGEAHGMRAYHHFVLLRHYGGVGVSGRKLGIPYLDRSLDRDSEEWKQLRRPSFQSTVESISKDLDVAIRLLPEKYEGDDRVTGWKNRNRMDKRIALAIKAQLYMHAASPAYNDGYYNVEYCDSAMKYSAKLIDLNGGIGGLGYTDNSIFWESDNIPQDVLWRTNQTDGTEISDSREARNYPPSRYGKGQVNPTQDFVDAFPDKDGYPITQSSVYNPGQPYLNRDPRLARTVIYNGASFGIAPSTIAGDKIYTAKEDTKDGIENPEATRTGYYLRKTLRPDFVINDPNRWPIGQKTIRPIIRFTEIYLIYAEAATASYDADGASDYADYTARDIIKAIRQRAGLGRSDSYASTLPASEFMDLVRNERRLELSFEGFRFYDLRRWKAKINGPVSCVLFQQKDSNEAPQYLPVDGEDRMYATFTYYAPLPEKELLKSPKLEQNHYNN